MYTYRRRSEGFLITLMLLFSTAIIYGIYVYNPYFMNRKPLSESLSENQNHTLTIPESKMESEGLGPWNFIESLNLSRTYVYNSDYESDVTYVREASIKLPISVNKNSVAPLWTGDESGHYYTYPHELVKTDFNNERSWFFRSHEKDKFMTSPVVGSHYLFITTESGLIYKLNKINGKLIWLIKYPGQLFNNFLPYNSFLFFITKEATEEFYINKINGQTGELQWKEPLIGFTSPSELTINEALKLLLVTDPNGSLLSIDLNNGNAYWQKKKLGNITTPASTIGESAYVANDEGMAMSLNLKKKQISWEYKLPTPAVSSFTYVPSYGLIAVLTENGYLQTIEARTGEGHWRYNTGLVQNNTKLFSIRMNSKGIKKYKLNWSHKGWVLISPCGDDRLCVFNPEKGQLVNRIRLRGQMSQHLPLFINQKMYALLKNPEKLPWVKSDEPEPNFSMGEYKVYNAPAVSNKPEAETTETIEE
ncbi:MAG: PQQ-binding-like beta-propeller repeat protein [Bdellovibrionaceae bacterium]|nr:PQQ-binding-like beta-propeller repeat protein [Pseudobdellovibrionaceae bacterium]